MGDFVASVIASPPFATQESVRALSTLPLPYILPPLKGCFCSHRPVKTWLNEEREKKGGGRGEIGNGKRGSQKRDTCHAIPEKKEKYEHNILLFWDSWRVPILFFSSLESGRKIRQLPDDATTNVVILEVGTILTKEKKKKNHLSGHFFLLQPLQETKTGADRQEFDKFKRKKKNYYNLGILDFSWSLIPLFM